MTEKKKFRNYCKNIRSTVDVSKTSDCVVRHIRHWSVYCSAKNIMLFYPVHTEITLLSLLEDSKSFYFPVIDGDNIYPVKYSPALGFNSGKYNIMEPVGCKLEDLSLLDIVFVPALGIDKTGCRIGYGKGFYDRFFTRLNSSTVTVVPIFASLIFDYIPKEPHDVKCDYVVSEHGVIYSSVQ